MKGGRERVGSSAEEVSWYEYYVPTGHPSEGLVAEGDHFTLNGQEFQVSSSR